MKTYEQKARAYASTNFAVQCSDVPAIVLDISTHLKRCYDTAVRETLEDLWHSVKQDGYPKPKDYEYDLFGVGGIFVMDVFLLHVRHKDGFKDVCTANFKVLPNGDKVWDFQDPHFEEKARSGEIVVTHWMHIPKILKQ